MASKKMKMYVEEEILKSYKSMYRLAYTYVKNEADALDVVQESVYKAIRNASKIKHYEYIKSWLYRIVINTSLDILHKRNKESLVEKMTEEIKEETNRDLDLINSLQNLTDKERLVIVLRFFEDMKINDIAGVLHENPNTIKSILYRALKKLRVDMEKGGYKNE
ncbi:MAG TPA: sigma-70 family RNA polymerase sigma factor [Defluviitaleaceae bacterium]|nr:sigma-70 family RNA polymerase sigma factor [Defluviitaleaceae bacterium]HPT77046.1 sigma-70 family RNA polymerase sigma factor [Defluviitaleaceae bacterium]HQD50888.1 sigma-70 family RNA polymerase sigma factor [Defluviitaleaceae bacterium]